MFRYVVAALASLCALGAIMYLILLPDPPQTGGLCAWTNDACTPDQSLLETVTAPILSDCLIKFESDDDDPLDRQTFAMRLADDLCQALSTADACADSSGEFQKLRNVVTSRMRCPTGDVCRFVDTGCTLDDVAFGVMFGEMVAVQTFPEAVATAARAHARRRCRRAKGPLACKMTSRVVARRTSIFVRNVRRDSPA